MSQTQENLSNRLLYLPLDLNEKVLLWLTYKGLKPVSEISVERRGNILVLLRRGIRRKSTYSYNSSKSKRIRKWIRNAGLTCLVDPKFNSSWFIGKDPEQVKSASKIIRKFDYESEIESGRLFGFPKKSVEAYAKNRIARSSKEKISMDLPIYSSDPFFKNQYFNPYVTYSLRADSVKEESRLGKNWADCIRKDVPALAKWFENREAKQRIKENKLQKDDC